MSDIVERLRTSAGFEHVGGHSGGLFKEAADEIASLRIAVTEHRKRAEALESDVDFWATTAREYKNNYNDVIRRGPRDTND